MVEITFSFSIISFVSVTAWRLAIGEMLFSSNLPAASARSMSFCSSANSRTRPATASLSVCQIALICCLRAPA